MTNRLESTNFTPPRSRLPHRVIALVGVLALGACASKPLAPTESLQMAEQAITMAEQARVADHASLELSQARDKLAAARVAVQDEKMVLAKRLADQAFVDAELATARAAEVKAKAVNDEMKQSTETLKQEMNRNTGAQK